MSLLCGRKLAPMTTVERSPYNVIAGGEKMMCCNCKKKQKNEKRNENGLLLFS